jgi:hypothetical protein
MGTDEAVEVSSEAGDGTEQQLEGALRLAHSTCEVVFSRFADPNILPFLHVVLVFMYHLTFYPLGMAVVEKSFPWKLLSMLLNSLLLSYRDYDRIHSNDFPRPEKELPRPLPEDFAMRALLWVDRYFPNDWYSNDKIDDDERYFEVASMTDERKERILWVGVAIARHGQWLQYDESLHQFAVAAPFEKEIGTTLLDSELEDASNIGSMTLLSKTETETNGSKASEVTPVKDKEDRMDVDEESTPVKRTSNSQQA